MIDNISLGVHMTAASISETLTSDEEQRVIRISEKYKEALGLATNYPDGDLRLEALLDDFIAELKKPSATVLPFVANTAEPVLNIQEPEQPVVVAEMPTPPPVTTPGPPTPVPISDEDDPRRPNFGEKQVRGVSGLVTGVKLRVCGATSAVLGCHKEDNIAVGTIVNELNKNGEVTVVSSPFQVDPSGRMVIIVKYTRSTMFNNPKDATSRIYLDQLSVTPIMEKTNRSWRIDCWLERLR